MDDDESPFEVTLAVSVVAVGDDVVVLGVVDVLLVEL